MSEVAPTIHVVDDDASFRVAISRLLQTAGHRVALYEFGDQLLQSPLVTEPGCILLDVYMPGLDGLQLQQRLGELGSILPIVFLTGRGDLAASVRAIKAGAEDFLSKPVTKGVLFDAIERALARHRKQRVERDRVDLLRARLSTLTPRQREVFIAVVRGKLNKQIAFELGTTERTVKAHRHAVMNKLKVHSVAAAATIAERLGMLDAPDIEDR